DGGQRYTSRKEPELVGHLHHAERWQDVHPNRGHLARTETGRSESSNREYVSKLDMDRLGWATTLREFFIASDRHRTARGVGQRSADCAAATGMVAVVGAGRAKPAADLHSISSRQVSRSYHVQRDSSHANESQFLYQERHHRRLHVF